MTNQKNPSKTNSSLGTMLFKRKIYAQMLDWKEKSAGSTALMIEGPRRVGKTTVVQEFASNRWLILPSLKRGDLISWEIFGGFLF